MADDKNPAPVLDTEVASRSRDPFEVDYLGIMRPNDSVLLEKGGNNWQIYRDLKRDGKVFSGLQKRVNSLIGYPWQIVPVVDSEKGRADAAKLADIIGGSQFDQLCRDLMDALLMGFSITEMVWTVVDQQIVPGRYAKRAQRRFVYVSTDDNLPPQLRMLTKEQMLKGVELPGRKFVVHRVNPEDDNPYGTGLGQQLYWPVFFKRKGVIAWNKLNDRFGAPTPHGKYPRGASDKEKNTLFGALKAISNDGVVMTPEGMSIDLLESKLTGSVSSQESLCQYMDDWISEVLMGQSSGKGSGGALAAAATERETVRLDLVQADSDLLSDTLNCTLIRWLCDFNGLEACLISREIKAPDDLKAASETDKNISEMGFKPTLERVRSRYGDGWEEAPAGGQGQPPGLQSSRAAFAEPSLPVDQVALDQALAQISSSELGAAAAEMLQPLIDAVESASSFEDALAKLEAAYPKMSTDKLQAMLANAMFGADVAGRLNADVY